MTNASFSRGWVAGARLCETGGGGRCQSGTLNCAVSAVWWTADQRRPTGCDLERTPCESTTHAVPTPAGGGSFLRGGSRGSCGCLRAARRVPASSRCTSAIDVPEPNELSQAQTSVVYYDNGKDELGRFAEVDRTLVDLSDVPEHVQYAVLAAEDRGFYENSGISLTGNLCARPGTTSLARDLRAPPRLRSNTHATPT